MAFNGIVLPPLIISTPSFQSRLSDLSAPTTPQGPLPRIQLPQTPWHDHKLFGGSSGALAAPPIQPTLQSLHAQQEASAQRAINRLLLKLLQSNITTTSFQQAPQQQQPWPRILSFPTAPASPTAFSAIFSWGTFSHSDPQATYSDVVEHGGPPSASSPEIFVEAEIVALYPRKKRGLPVPASQDAVFLDKKVLSALYHLPLKDAADALGLCPTAIKTACRKLGLPRWPFRTVRKNRRRRMIAARARGIVDDSA
eukprot:880522-Rhodomonas_salina.2